MKIWGYSTCYMNSFYGARTCWVSPPAPFPQIIAACLSFKKAYNLYTVYLYHMYSGMGCWFVHALSGPQALLAIEYNFHSAVVGRIVRVHVTINIDYRCSQTERQSILSRHLMHIALRK